NHIYVHDSVAADLVTAMTKELRRQFGKDHATNPSYPRMITSDHTESLADLLAETTGDVVYGGNSDPTKRYFEPTIVTDVEEDDALMSRERSEERRVGAAGMIAGVEGGIRRHA